MRYLHSFLLIICLGLASCEELIDVNLNDVDPRYVIEGDLTDLSADQVITVSQTVAFDAPVRNKPVENAIVTVTDDKGTIYAFTKSGDGIYRANFKPKALRTYNLKVVIEGEVFAASSYMNSYIDVDSLGVIEDVIFTDTVYSVTQKFMDPKDQPNYYKYKISVNGSDFAFSRVFSDKFNDGMFVTHQISDPNNDIFLGDSVVVNRQIIDKQVFDYWNELQSINPGSAAPANPTSNISNGALGYFSVSSSKRYGYRVRFTATGN
ncbi:DUF4249 domain-containing protein [Sphingobacterium bovistauri]|uniref:DUF4249 domain-containing protein n=1 Tax=Sphingobacterium bovistauri TaxID=2781959 RepID=A0ABS7Z3V5_9SPHI|nr:DUF4249 domain-containing protein [Sphingobacterium bovistauri]MCA5004868.1 DUF4249 domain-containing protein [Sphingobacterium bovistauri]